MIDARAAAATVPYKAVFLYDQGDVSPKRTVYGKAGRGHIVINRRA